MTEPDNGDRVDKVEKAAQALAEEKSFRRDVLDRLRNIGKDVSAVERLIVDDFARADQEIRRG